jgi:hypothetical protein
MNTKENDPCSEKKLSGNKNAKKLRAKRENSAKVSGRLVGVNGRPKVVDSEMKNIILDDINEDIEKGGFHQQFRFITLLSVRRIILDKKSCST